MPISKSINLLQNPIDIPDKYAEDYYIQALANLGQRIGIKGDGITYKSFSFLDSFTNIPSYSYDTYIGYLKYSHKSNDELIAEFGVVKKDLTEYKSLEITKNINNTFYFENELSLSTMLNNIEKYSKNSIIINQDGTLTIMLVEKLIGTYDDDKNNSILQYFKFDINTNKLIYNAKLYFAYSDGRSNYYALQRTINIIEDNAYTNNYQMTVQLFNSSIIGPSYKESFENIFTYESYRNTGDISFTLLRPEFINIDILESYNDSMYNFDGNSPVALILHNIENSYKYKPYKINLQFDTSKNELLSVDDIYENETYIICKDEYGINLDEEILLLNEDINQLYHLMFLYYNENFYTSTNSKFFQRILCKIYERLSTEYSNSLDNIMYFPLNYTIDYLCNSQDNSKIYFSNNIYITCTSLSDIEYIEDFWNNNTNIVFDYNDINKINVFAFNILYNSKYDELINSVNVKDIYTMPYINANENWSINNIDTKIKAKGDDAGNPNIIILYSKDQNNTLDSYNIITSVVNNEVINNCEFEPRYFYLDNALFENISNVDIICHTYMPIITQYNYSYFKNSIIINVCELDCIEQETVRSNYLGSNILSLWYLEYDNETNNIKYVPVLANNSNCALPFGSTINILNETYNDKLTKINTQDLILLNATIKILAQQNFALNSNHWLVIKNKLSNEYDNILNNMTYLNDLNAIVQYNDNVYIKQNTIKTSQTKKYIDSLDYIDITNALYPKYEISVSTATLTGEQIVDKIEEELVQNNVSKITIDGETITNIDEVYEEVRDIVKDKAVETYTYDVKIETENKLNANYNEYVFNSNIPTLDLKEIFIRNDNVLNRVNILSIDNNGNIYNGYIGTSFNDQSKSTMHIGSTSTNVNIGSDTLMKESDKLSFKVHDTLSIDFENVIFNSNKILLSKPIINVQNINNKEFFNAQINMLDSLMESPLTIDVINATMINNWNSNNMSLFNKFNNNYYLCISNVLKKYFNDTIENYKVFINGKTEIHSSLDIISIKTSDETLCFYKLPNSLTPFNDLLSMNIINFGKVMNFTYYKTTQYNDITSNVINIYISIN